MSKEQTPEYHQSQQKAVDQNDIIQSAQLYADHSGQENASEWDQAYYGYKAGFNDCLKLNEPLLPRLQPAQSDAVKFAEWVLTNKHDIREVSLLDNWYTE